MHTFQQIQDKICDWETIKLRVSQWQASGEKVVFTNGCFDILHYGHLHYLAAAYDLGDRLIIGLNNAESVRALKGPHRPINDELTRGAQMAALSFVDSLAFFGEETPKKLIEFLSPDILVKGGDWKMHQIVGADWVLNNGGSVKSLPYIEGYSTTNIEEKIKRSPI